MSDKELTRKLKITSGITRSASMDGDVWKRTALQVAFVPRQQPFDRSPTFVRQFVMTHGQASLPESSSKLSGHWSTGPSSFAAR